MKSKQLRAKNQIFLYVPYDKQILRNGNRDMTNFENVDLANDTRWQVGSCGVR